MKPPFHKYWTLYQNRDGNCNIIICIGLKLIYYLDTDQYTIKH